VKRTGIVIINWNASKDTINCVNNLNLFIDNEASIYIVDNNSAIEDREQLRSAWNDAIIILNEENFGYAGGNNVGICKAVKGGHEFILLMNNDARIEKKDFRLLVQAMDAEPKLGIVGPVIRDSPGGAILNAGGKDIGRHYISHFKKPLQLDALYDVDYVSGTVCLIRAALFDTIGLLDEDYFFSGEVADFCIRTKNAETCFRTAVQPLAEATHDLSASHGNRGGIYTYYTVRNRFLYIRKHLRSSIPALFPYWTVLHLRHAFRCFQEKKKTELRMVLKGLAHGLRGKFGKYHEVDQKTTCL